MSRETMLYILSYFEGRIDIYDCVYYYKMFLTDTDELNRLTKYINYLEGNCDCKNLDGDYLFDLEEYLLEIISKFLESNNFHLDINFLDMSDIKSYLIRCN